MKRKNYLLLFVLILFLLSCFGNKQNATINASDLLKDEEQSSSNLPLSIEDIKKIIRETEEEYLRRYNADIAFIEKANFGIPGGDNWIVRLSNRTLLVYVINNNKIDKEYNFTSFNHEEYSNFNIMQNIPGTRIDSSTSSFGDYNNDGIDEMFVYGFYGRAFEIVIRGYDVEKDDFTVYCEIPFEIIDPDNGPAPVEFTTYRGMYGFKVFFFQYDVAGGPDWVPDPNLKNGKWIFYTWDAEKREYIEVGEVVDE